MVKVPGSNPGGPIPTFYNFNNSVFSIKPFFQKVLLHIRAGPLFSKDFFNNSSFFDSTFFLKRLSSHIRAGPYQYSTNSSERVTLITSKQINGEKSKRIKIKPPAGVGPATPTLPRWCSTTEPRRQTNKKQSAGAGIRTQEPTKGLDSS